MSEKILRGINFPGLEDTYMVPQVDATLSASGASADAKVVGDEIKNLQNAIKELGSEFKYTDANNLLIASYTTNSGTSYYSCNYGTSISVQDGSVVVDDVSTITSASSLDTMTSTLKGNYVVLGGGVYYIPEDAVFTTPNTTENYITTYYLRVDKAQLVEAKTGGVSGGVNNGGLIVQITGSDGNYTASNTFAEISAAVNSGRYIVVDDNSTVYPLFTFTESGALFLITAIDDATGTVRQIGYTIDSSDNVSFLARSQSGSSGGSDNIFVVTVDFDTMKASHTSEEIGAAVDADKVVMTNNGVPFSGSYPDYSVVSFEVLVKNSPTEGSVARVTIDIDKSGNVTLTEEKYILPPNPIGTGISGGEVLTIGNTGLEWKGPPVIGEVTEVELINGTFTTEFYSDLGAFAALIPYSKSLDTVPEKVNVSVNGVAYKYMPVTNVPGLGDCVGNLSMLNPMGFSYPDTGESFIVGVGTDSALVTTDLTQSKTGSLILTVVEADVIKTLAPEYLAPNPEVGKVLTMTASGPAWVTPTGGSNIPSARGVEF